MRRRSIPVRGRFWKVLLWVMAALFVAPAAFAQNKSTIQVLAITSDKGFEQAQAMTIALKRAVTRAEGWSLAKGDFSLEVMTAAMGCTSPPNDACLKKVQAKVGSKRFVWGTLELQGKEAVCHLRLWEDNQNKRETTVRYSSNLTDASDDTLLQIAENAFAQLTGAAQGVLVVNAGDVRGDVYVDGQNMGPLNEGRAELPVPSGEHEVRVVAQGYNDAVGTVTVRPGASAEITLNPTRRGGALPPGSGGVEDSGVSDSGSKTSARKIIGYAGIGVGSALALVGGYFWLQTSLNSDDDAFVAFKNERDDQGQPIVGKGQDTCDVAERVGRADIVDHCDKHATQKTLAWVLIPSGVVIAAAGAYFLLTDDSDSREGRSARQRKPRVVPLVGVGPKGGQVHLQVAF